MLMLLLKFMYLYHAWRSLKKEGFDQNGMFLFRDWCILYVSHVPPQIIGMRVQDSFPVLLRLQVLGNLSVELGNLE